MSQTQQPRRRRQHKRSRNGCWTCKQRHIRCDEQKPICTNCLVRGGACGYPAAAGDASPTDAASVAGSHHDGATTPELSGAGAEQAASWPFEDAMGGGGTSELPFRGGPYVPSPDLAFNPVDPFDSLPVAMPQRSMDLFYHMTHYRILTRSLVPKNPNNACLGMALQDAGLFRSCLLLSAMHYSWIHGSLGDAEETYLYHKVEALRMVNEHIADPAASEMCANLIAALALAESGIGDIAAAEAHLNGLFTLINRRKPEEWQGHLHGLFQRVVLVAGTFISAKKGILHDGGGCPNRGSHRGGDVPSSMSSGSGSPHFGRPPAAAAAAAAGFGGAEFDAAKLSPFYFEAPPDFEASNADLEGMAITSALQRLSALQTQPCGGGGQEAPPAAESAASSVYGSPESHSYPASAASPDSTAGSEAAEAISVSQELTQVLLLETESYLASLLFKPDISSSSSCGLNRSPMSQHQPIPSPSASPMMPYSPDLFMADPMGSSSSAAASPAATSGGSMSQAAASPAFKTMPPPALSPYAAPFGNVSPAAVPSSASSSSSSSSSRAWAAAAYIYLHSFLAPLWHPHAPVDPDLLRWLLDTLCMSLERTKEAMAMGACSRELWLWQVLIGGYVAATTQSAGSPIPAKPQEPVSCIDPSLLDPAAGGHAAAAEGTGPLNAWFRKQLRAWSDAAGVRDWEEAKAVASKVAWPHAWDGESAVEELWRRAMAEQGSP